MAESLRRQLEKRLVEIASREASKPVPADFEAPSEVKKDASELETQKGKHRETLLNAVLGLSLLSFALLAYVVIDQMNYRKEHPDYIGVSDSVIKFLAISVFGQVLALVATIVRHVWKDRP